MTAEELGDRIRGAAQLPSGQWAGRCPAHDDRHESLSWRDGRQGVVMTCHAGCSLEQITRALGLEVASLFSGNGHAPPAKAASKADPKARKPAGTIVATYDYHDASGALLYQVCRMDPKDFRQRRPDGKGGWIWSIGETARVVYRLPQLAGQARAWFVEGEKDADRLVSLGLAATTAAGGALAWRPEYAGQLHGAGVRDMVIVADHDQPGRAYAEQVAASCTAVGIRCRVLAQLPGLVSAGGDVSDWLDAGATVDDLARVASEAPVWTAPERGALPPGLTIELVGDSYYVSLGEGVLAFAGLEEHRGDLGAMVTATNTATGKTFWGRVNLAAPRSRADLARTLDERCRGADWRTMLDDGAAEVARRHMAGEPAVELIGEPPQASAAWWVPGLVPMDVVTLLFGKGGSGKSITALALALSSLRPAALGGSRGWAVRPMRSVLYLDWEADQGAVWRRAWGLAGAEGVEIPPGLHYLRMTRPLAQSIQQVSQAIRDHQVEALIVDSWVPATGTNARNDADGTSQIMAAIRTLGRTTLGIAHVTNAAADGEAESRPFGSVFNQNLARSLVEVTSESEGNALRVSYRHTKVNDGALARSRGLVFTYAEDGQIAVESGEPDLTKMSLPEQIKRVLASGAKPGHEIAEEIGESVESVTRILRRGDGRTFTRTEGGQAGGRGRKVLWGLMNKPGHGIG